MWKKTASKYRNKKTISEGVTCDSKLEAALYSWLLLRQRAGEIRDLSHHPGTIFLSRARIQYRPDFSWIDAKTEERCYGEAKGMETPIWRLKRKLWLAYGERILYVWIGKPSALKLKETLVPNLQNSVDAID